MSNHGGSQPRGNTAQEARISAEVVEVPASGSKIETSTLGSTTSRPSSRAFTPDGGPPSTTDTPTGLYALVSATSSNSQSAAPPSIPNKRRRKGPPRHVQPPHAQRPKLQSASARAAQAPLFKALPPQAQPPQLQPHRAPAPRPGSPQGYGIPMIHQGPAFQNGVLYSGTGDFYKFTAPPNLPHAQPLPSQIPWNTPANMPRENALGQIVGERAQEGSWKDGHEGETDGKGKGKGKE